MSKFFNLINYLTFKHNLIFEFKEISKKVKYLAKTKEPSSSSVNVLENQSNALVGNQSKDLVGPQSKALVGKSNDNNQVESLLGDKSTPNNQVINNGNFFKAFKKINFR